MATRRRWLQFSLRGFFLVLTIGCIWLGWKVERVREQREARKAIIALGGYPSYNFQVFERITGKSSETVPKWLTRLLGRDCFYTIEEVDFGAIPHTPEEDVLELLPYLRRLRGLRIVAVARRVSKDTLSKLTAALPGCELVTGYGDRQ